MAVLRPRSTCGEIQPISISSYKYRGNGASQLSGLWLEYTWRGAGADYLVSQSAYLVNRAMGNLRGCGIAQ